MIQKFKQLSPISNVKKQCSFCNSIVEHKLIASKSFLEGATDNELPYRIIECPKCGNYIYPDTRYLNYDSKKIANFLKNNAVFDNKYYFFGCKNTYMEYFFEVPTVHYVSVDVINNFSDGIVDN